MNNSTYTMSTSYEKPSSIVIQKNPNLDDRYQFTTEQIELLISRELAKIKAKSENKNKSKRQRLINFFSKPDSTELDTITIQCDLEIKQYLISRIINTNIEFS